MSHRRTICIGMLWRTLACLPGGCVTLTAGDAAAYWLANDKLQVTVSNTGKLLAVENRLATETYEFGADAFELDTDLGLMSNQVDKPVSVRQEKDRIVYRFDFGQPGRDRTAVELVYTLGVTNGFFRRTLSLSNSVALRVNSLRFGATISSEPAREVVHYVTFIAAPTVEFIRHARGGLFTGIENPYFKADLTTKRVALGFEPALILQPGEGYRSEPQFMGVYKMSGVMSEDSGRDFRYNSNGSGYKPLDRNETRAMRAFALDYLAPVQQRFLNINYQFFHPLPQMPHTDQDKDYFIKTLDTFAAIGGDMLVFKPLHPYSKPDANRPFWDVVPDDPTHPARQICDYATSKGLAYGFYMGCAAHGAEGDAGGLNFRPEMPGWKKSDAAGNRAPDNCLACDEFFEWWFMVQNNTIRKYHLGNWSWDPSLGSGMNCHDASHGHLANQGGYKGWRRGVELMARLKAANPGLFIQGFYGTKNFGLWGLKNVDQHEVYNEQSMCVSTRHAQISDDRQNADGLRFQNNWSMRFRFSPAVMGHALTHRVSEGGFDPELIKAWDYAGWQYAVMSSLAVSGSIMPTILPYQADRVPGLVAFYQKWGRWARDNFGEQVQPGAVDGYARIQGDHGFVFLFNGNPRPAVITFEVGDEINLQSKGNYQFTELYPSDRAKRVLDNNGKSVFAMGELASLTVPANGCYLLELSKATPPRAPVLVGAAGEAVLTGGELAITGLSGRPGELTSLRVGVARPGSVQRVTANGIAQQFTRTGHEICLQLQFAGAGYVRALDTWTQGDGKRFDFPYHAAQPALELTTRFTLNAGVRQLLARAQPQDGGALDVQIAGWQQQRTGSYAYHNFIGERPSRLWLIVPFLTHVDFDLTLNGGKVEPVRWDDPSNSAVFDLTERAVYGGDNTVTLTLKGMDTNRFMGPFLIYPDEPATGRVLPAPVLTDQPVCYTRVLVPALRPRYRAGAGPQVLEAKMTGPVTQKEAAELRVTLDLAPERIRRVLYFESGFPWMGQHDLRYDPAAQSWTAKVAPGPRTAIQEHDCIYVWAEGADGLRSEYYPVRVTWNFGDALQH